MDIQQITNYVTTHIEQLGTIGFTGTLFARLITALTKSKRDDEIAGFAEKGFRRIVEVIAGANHEALVKKEDAPISEELTEDSDIDRFNRVLKQYGAKLVIQVDDNK